MEGIDPSILLQLVGDYGPLVVVGYIQVTLLLGYVGWVSETFQIKPDAVKWLSWFNPAWKGWWPIKRTGLLAGSYGVARWLNGLGADALRDVILATLIAGLASGFYVLSKRKQQQAAQGSPVEGAL